ncbi:MAG TPA: SDR family NAD(P)-dependent oxidoreductase, partial [Solirubrobacteraceae bacterium]|nr:SDR family NAD(P)-dependent oxidoreductase [Solirubrobacteraceae bacterium]
MDELRGRTVLITGASSGVGLAAASAFARAGCDVAVLARGEEGLAEAARRVRAPARR